MVIYIMRHGTALPVGNGISEDAQRPLSPKGKTQVRRVGEALKKTQGSVGAIIASPLVRAQQTARIMAEAMKSGEIETSSALAPSLSLPGLRKILSDHAAHAAILLVGHHPDVTLAVAFLTGLDASVCPLFGTAAIAAIQLPSQEKKAELLWYQTSDQLSQP